MYSAAHIHKYIYCNKVVNTVETGTNNDTFLKQISCCTAVPIFILLDYYSKQHHHQSPVNRSSTGHAMTQHALGFDFTTVLFGFSSNEMASLLLEREYV